MEIISNIPINIDVGKLCERMRLEAGSGLAREFEELVCEAQERMNPKAMYREAFVDAKGTDSITIEGVTFTSRILRVNLDRTERVFPFVATCGTEFDTIDVPARDFLKQFWLDELRQYALECIVEHLNDYLDRKFALGKSASMNPGSGDVNVWPIEQQQQLFSLLGNVTAGIGVELTDNCLMIPNKSVSGIRFPTETDFRSCQVCRRPQCRHRKAPFDVKLWRLYEHGLASED